MAYFTITVLQPFLAVCLSKNVYRHQSKATLLAFGGMMAWVLPLLPTLAISENCSGLWRRFLHQCWAPPECWPCEAYRFGTDQRLCSDFGRNTLYCARVFDVCLERWKWNGTVFMSHDCEIIDTQAICSKMGTHFERCTMAVLDAFGPFLLAKVLLAPTPSLLILLMCRLARKEVPRFLPCWVLLRPRSSRPCTQVDQDEEAIRRSRTKLSSNPSPANKEAAASMIELSFVCKSPSQETPKPPEPEAMTMVFQWRGWCRFRNPPFEVDVPMLTFFSASQVGVRLIVWCEVSISWGLAFPSIAFVGLLAMLTEIWCHQIARDYFGLRATVKESLHGKFSWYIMLSVLVFTLFFLFHVASVVGRGWRPALALSLAAASCLTLFCTVLKK